MVELKELIFINVVTSTIAVINIILLANVKSVS